MIVLITEWCGNNESSYFIDTNKLNLNIAFEAALDDIISSAIVSDDEIINPLHAFPDYHERFGIYQDDLPDFKRLCVQPPCKFDRHITIWHTD